MEPDSPNVPARGLPHDLFRDIGMRGDDHAIQLSGNAGQVWIALRAFNFGGIWVYGKRFVTALAKFGEHGVRGAVSPARHASDGDALSAQKVRNECRNLRHQRLPVRFNHSARPTASRPAWCAPFTSSTSRRFSLLRDFSAPQRFCVILFFILDFWRVVYVVRARGRPRSIIPSVARDLLLLRFAFIQLVQLRYPLASKRFIVNY